MCEQHHGLATKETKRIPPIVALGGAATGEQLKPLLTEVSKKTASRVAKIRPEADKPVATPAKTPPPTPTQTSASGEQAVETAKPDENPRKTGLIQLLQNLQTRVQNNTVPGKKQTERHVWITSQIAEFLGVQMPLNAERNFGKSEGFRRNLFTRIRHEAEKLLEKEESDRTLPDFMRQ